MNWQLLSAGAELNRYYLILFGFARVRDLNDNSRGAVVKGPNWQIELWDRDRRVWNTMLNKHSHSVSAFTAVDAWKEALAPLPNISHDLMILREFLPKVELQLTTRTNAGAAWAVDVLDLVAWPAYRAIGVNDNPALAAVRAILRLNDERHNTLAVDMRNFTAASPRRN